MLATSRFFDLRYFLNMEKAILATLAYYDVLDLPLTLVEVASFLISPKQVDPFHQSFAGASVVSLDEIKTNLDKLIGGGTIATHDGFYFLTGREKLCAGRLAQQKNAEQKWEKARRYISWAQAVPFIEGIFASGSLALGFMESSSDLDVLVVTKPGRIWLARLWLSFWLELIGKRRRGRDRVAPDKICLNHYISSDALTLRWHSLYNAQTYLHLVPLLVRDHELINRFQRENNWMLNYVNNWPDLNGWQRRAVKLNHWLVGWAKVGEAVLEFTGLAVLLEKFARALQKSRIARGSKNKGIGRITINEQELEFHPHSPEYAVLNKFNQRVKQLPGLADYQENNSGLEL